MKILLIVIFLVGCSRSTYLEDMAEIDKSLRITRLYTMSSEAMVCSINYTLKKIKDKDRCIDNIFLKRIKKLETNK